MLSLASASSSRLITSLPIPTLQVRHVHRKYPKRHPRAFKQPIIRSPHFPRLPLPSSGAAQSHPRNLVSEEEYIHSTTFTQLDSTAYTFHHTPPASAPSYTNGLKPDLLRWLGGESVKLSGEEVAPLVREGREPIGGLPKSWGEGMLRDIKEARAQGLSRSMIGKRYGIPEEATHLIARVAPLTIAQLDEKARLAEEASLNMGREPGFKKRVAAALRKQRREYW